MLNILHQVEGELPELLLAEGRWKSVFINYHHPFVERIWANFYDYRIYLHKVHPCETSESLIHPHPWPSGIKILSEDVDYEMGIGYGVGEDNPTMVAKMIMRGGSEYEMTHPDGWHYVRPINKPVMSLMITGQPWDRPSPKSDKILESLNKKQEEDIFKFFRDYYLR